jgi:quaternary ammonium compound-resistance protein SugE
VNIGPWLWVFLAGLLEIGWAVGLKLSPQKPSLWLPTVIGMILSFVFLAQGMKALPVGTAYAVWTGIGAAGTAVVGMVWLGEPRETARLVSLALVAAGIVGLKLFSR